MKYVKMRELNKGDIFTFSAQIHNRKSYEVLENPIPEKTKLKVFDRVDNIECAKQIKGTVLLLKGTDNG